MEQREGGIVTSIDMVQQEQWPLEGEGLWFFTTKGFLATEGHRKGGERAFIERLRGDAPARAEI